MLRIVTSRLTSSKSTFPIACISKRFESQNAIFNDQQGPYYTAKDVEFCPGRAKDVMQNNVEETSCNNTIHDGFVADGTTHPTAAFEEEHTKAYRADNSVSLYSVMQSNVPDPFNTTDKAPIHMNMPGGSSTRNYKYLSDKMQTAHHTRQ